MVKVIVASKVSAAAFTFVPVRRWSSITPAAPALKIPASSQVPVAVPAPKVAI